MHGKCSLSSLKRRIADRPHASRNCDLRPTGRTFPASWWFWSQLSSIPDDRRVCNGTGFTLKTKLDDRPRLDEHPGDGVTRGSTRMEIFADAVFAIAFTLPMVEITLPEVGSDLGRQLLALWPSYLGYALSTLVIGTYWVRHHFAGALFRTIGHRFLMATLLFLAAVAFIAIPTRAFAEHIQDPIDRIVGAQFYAVALAATSVIWWFSWRTARVTGDLDERLDAAYVIRLDQHYVREAAAMVVAAILVFFSWELGLALAGAITLYQLRPPETPLYVNEAPVIEEEL